jgi:hypothetical protein
MTKHTCGGPVFGRLAEPGTCPRCDELRAGAPVRQWAGAAVRARRDAYATDGYCFCGGTFLGTGRCPQCGRRPYTD